MPNIKSAKKQLKQSIARRAANMPVRTRVKSSRRAFMESVATANTELSDSAYRTYCSVLDKAVKKGVIKKNTAVRRKARAAQRVRKQAAAATATAS